MNNPLGTSTESNTKLVAVFSYITIVGLLVCYFINKEEKNAFVTWHIKNMFGLSIMYFIAFMFSQNEQLLILGGAFFYTSTIFWLFSIIMCLFNKTQGIPWLSGQFQKWFSFLN